MPKKGVKIDPYANGAEKSYFSKQVFPKFIQAKYLQCQKCTAKKLNFAKLLRFKLRWKSRIPLKNRSKNQILLSNLTILMKIQARKSYDI